MCLSVAQELGSWLAAVDASPDLLRTSRARGWERQGRDLDRQSRPISAWPRGSATSPSLRFFVQLSTDKFLTNYYRRP